jgi:miniconductance mechanosensitive channel
MTAEFKKDLVDRNLILETDNPISNLAAFEIWLLRMLEQNGDITKELTCMVRQTEPSDTGIPVEIYAFTKTRDWVEYEKIQTAVFDLIYITAQKFSLQIYQRTGDKYLPAN